MWQRSHARGTTKKLVKAFIALPCNRVGFDSWLEGWWHQVLAEVLGKHGVPLPPEPVMEEAVQRHNRKLCSCYEKEWRYKAY